MSGKIIFTWGEENNRGDDRDVTKKQPQQNGIEDVVLIEYIKVVENEYTAERNKKNSFEMRAGFLFTFLGAIIIFLIQKVPFKTIVLGFTMETCNCFLIIKSICVIIKSICGAFVYFFLVLTIIKLIELVNVKQHKNFEVKEIDENLLSQSKIEALYRLIVTYRDCIIHFREQNEKRAAALKRVLYYEFLMLAFLVIFVNIDFK